MAPPSLGIPDVNFKGSKTRVCDFDHAYTDNTRPLVEAANAGVPHQDMELSTRSAMSHNSDEPSVPPYYGYFCHQP